MPPRARGKATDKDKDKDKESKKTSKSTKKQSQDATRTSPRKRGKGAEGEGEEHFSDAGSARDVSPSPSEGGAAEGGGAPEGGRRGVPDSGPIDLEIEKKIAAFYEANPMFYDLSHIDHKNSQKRNAALKEFADSIGLTRE